MALNLATLNAGGLKDPSKCVHLLGELSYISVDVAEMQETMSSFKHMAAVVALRFLC